MRASRDNSLPVEPSADRRIRFGQARSRPDRAIAVHVATGSLCRFRADLASEAPHRVDYQRDLMAALCRLGLRRALRILVSMKESGGLDPLDQAYIQETGRPELEG